MPFSNSAYTTIQDELSAKHITLVAVTKTKKEPEIMDAYMAGIRDFGENYVQELVSKYEALPKDIKFHFIGHLQSNKAKYIVPFIHLIHSVDSEKLLTEISKQAVKAGRTVDCLLQIYIASEETKFGFDEIELSKLALNKYPNVRIKGLMGMASFSTDKELVRGEFKKLSLLYETLKVKHGFSILSMGMSADYQIAISEGSNMVRIGSILFGERG